ncbi:MAG TPA: hypothetical protein VGD80_31990, partial [Kofleriaceae bacterium]
TVLRSMNTAFSRRPVGCHCIAPLVPVAAAHDLHRRIPGAELEVFPGMGHDLPRALIPAFTTRIVAHLRRAEAPPGSAVS